MLLSGNFSEIRTFSHTPSTRAMLCTLCKPLRDPGPVGSHRDPGAGRLLSPPGGWIHCGTRSGLGARRSDLYIVHMRRVTASEARRNWFRLLDDVAQGAVICVERGGRRIVLRRESDLAEGPACPDYAQFLQVPDLEEADRWGWSWSEANGELEPEEEDSVEPEA